MCFQYNLALNHCEMWGFAWECDFGCQTKHVPPNFDDPRCMMISRIASCNALTDLKPEIRSSIYCSGHGTVVMGGGFTENGAEYRRLEVVMVFMNLDSSATFYFVHY